VGGLLTHPRCPCLGSEEGCWIRTHTPAVSGVYPGGTRPASRVITAEVTPSLHVDYKSTTIKQYQKEGRALRTETTINNTRDFTIGKRLTNLAALREVGFTANRRILRVQRLDHDRSPESPPWPPSPPPSPHRAAPACPGYAWASNAATPCSPHCKPPRVCWTV